MCDGVQWDPPLKWEALKICLDEVRAGCGWEGQGKECDGVEWESEDLPFELKTSQVCLDEVRAGCGVEGQGEEESQEVHGWTQSA